MFIQTEPTPNPAALKFLPGRPVLPHGTLDIRDKDGAAQSRLRSGCSQSRASAASSLVPTSSR